MEKKLLKRLSKILFFTVFLFGIAFQGVYSQSQSLQSGDLMIVTVNADKNEDGIKTFGFVPLVDLQSGTKIKFTDAAYIDSTGSLKDNEGTITYTAPSDFNPGEVITYAGEDESDNGFVKDGRFEPSASGDNIIAYQIDSSTNDTTYLYGIGWGQTDIWNYDNGTNTSDIPPELDEADNTILSLGAGDNYQYNSDNGLEGTVNSLLHLIGNEENWLRNDDDSFSAFSLEFSLVSPPTIAFTSATLSGEEGNTINLSVELVEADKADVSVDVEFLSGSSTADHTDIDDYALQTFDFTGASGGTSQNIPITLTGSDDFEGTEKAVFQLRNNSEGTIISPSELTLSIVDDDAPDIIFNEINADPGDDANNDDTEGDGETDEFIEWVNNEDTDIDISGWTYADDSGDRFTFPKGTIIPAGNAVVLFDNGSGDEQVQPQGGFGGAYIFTAPEVSLNNESEQLSLSDSDGNTVATADYSNEAVDQSNVLSPEITGSNYVDHSELSSKGLLSSPGTDVDGNPFGSKHAIGIRGSEGWRMITSPVEGATFDDLFGDFWMQGPANSNDPDGDFNNSTIRSWSENGGSFSIPANMDDNLVPGQGYFVYVFEDDEYNKPGIQGGFPKVINTDDTENSSPVNVEVSATDVDDSDSIDNDAENEEGWNLLGNPFDTDISVSAVYDALETADDSANTNIYVWNHNGNGGNGEWVILDGTEGSGDTIAPFQAFFVRYNSEMSGTVSFNKNALEANKGTEFFKNSSEKPITFDLELHGEQYFDNYSVEFSENGTTDLDRYDAYKLFSLNPNSINLFSTLNDNRLQKNALPRALESTLEIPLFFNGSGRTSLTFRWNKLQDIPTEWDVFLMDKNINRKINLRTTQKYSFNTNAEEQSKNSFTASDEERLLNRLFTQGKVKDNNNPRFVLSVQPKEMNSGTDDMPQSVKLNPNYPNPFNPETTIPYELDEDAEVTLTIWNMIGQKVATLVDGPVEAGEHEEPWNASNMPSGMYIARFEVAGEVFTRKMTLIK